MSRYAYKRNYRVLSRNQMKKSDKNGSEYVLMIPCRIDDDVDRTIQEILKCRKAKPCKNSAALADCCDTAYRKITFNERQIKD